MINIPSSVPDVSPVIETASAVPNPAEFAASKVSGIAGALGSIFAPAAALGLTWVGFKMIVTGKSPFQKN